MEICDNTQSTKIQGIIKLPDHELNPMKVEVLLVDDDEQIRQMMYDLLTSLDCVVVAEAENGAQAVEKYSSHSPHVTLLDINMPVMNGIDALKKIKALNPDAFVVMVTSITGMEAMEECYAAGASHYLRKDIPVPDIIAAIKDSWFDRLQEIVTG